MAAAAVGLLPTASFGASLICFPLTYCTVLILLPQGICGGGGGRALLKSYTVLGGVATEAEKHI